MVDKSEKFSWLVRAGYLSRGILYSVLGFIAFTSASEISEGTKGIFMAVQDMPAANPILWLMTIGLFAYALFRFASTFFDIENNGSDSKGWAHRIGHAGSGVGHLALAYTAYQFASSGGSEGGGAEKAASSVLSVGFGGIALGLLGLIFFATSVFQAQKGITGKFMNRISGDAPDGTRWLGGIGYCARAVVYAVIGWSLFSTGFMSGGAEDVKTLGAAVASLAGEGLLFILTAIGLLIFGLFSLVLARYRIIPELNSDGTMPNFRA